MKKSGLLIFAALLVLTLLFVACDKGNDPQQPSDSIEEATTSTLETPGETTSTPETEPHEHAFGEWTTIKEATCTEQGEQQRTCDCGEVETQSLDALGHTETVDAAVDPTCTETGLTEGTHCSVCQEVLTAQDTIPALGHTEVIDQAVAPTCTEKGLTEGKHCSVCEQVLVEQTVVPALGHAYTDVVTAPTCTDRGYTTHTCDCGDSYVDAYVGALGHTYTEVVTAPTCTDRGYTTYTCDCGDSYIGSYVGMVDHVYGEWYTTIEPTCTATGTKRHDCENCDYYEVQSIAVTGHSHEAVVTAPTCTERGYTTHTCHCGDSYIDTYVAALGHTEVIDAAVAPTCTAIGLTEGKHCSVCNEVLIAQTVVPATGHSHEAVVTAPTCTEQGYTTYTCHCGDTYIADYVDELGHAEVIDEAVAPTCTATGLTEGKHCSVCNEVLVAQEVVPAKGHTAGAAVVENATSATCGEAGSYDEVVYCSDCGVELSREHKTVEMLPHSPATAVKENVVNATCAAEGSYESVVYCSVCSEEISREVIVTDKLAHTEVIDAAVAPTCTATGLTEGKHCSVCNGVLVAQTVVPATGHTEVIDAAVAPTCTATGLTEGKHCSVCNEVLVAQTVIPALGHTEVTDAAVAPTCTTAGLTEGKHCSVCGEVLVAQIVVPAIGHSHEAVVTAPTCTEKGYTTYYCHCGDTYVDSYVDELGHTEVIDAAVAPTCTEIGLTEGKHCSECGEILVVQLYVPATGHNYETVVTAPTCTEKGYTTYTCHCGDNFVADFVSELGHTEVIDAAVTPTCTETGLTEGRHCSICNVVIVAQEIVPATDHTYGAVITAPTCTEKGYTTYTCHCGDNYIDDYVDVLGHTEVVKEAVAPTCTATGWTESRYCPICDEVFVAREVVPATGHTMVDNVCVTCGHSECLSFSLKSDGTYSISVTDRSKLPAELIIPTSYLGKAVTGILNYAFSDCTGLTTVIIPNSVTSIGNDAFKGCTNLTSITIPDSVTSIGSSALSGCSSLTSIIIPDSVTSIGSAAFYDCTSLTNITIPEGVTSIGYSTFGYCGSLTSINIPDSVTSIGSAAFYGCAGLTSITIPDSVTSIGYEAFLGCDSLVSITIPFVGTDKDGTSGTHFGYIFGASLSSSNSSYVPTSLKTVVVTGCSSIGNRAFNGCTNLTSVTILDGITSIGERAFQGCTGLTSITMPNSVTTIGYGAFSGCTSLTSITIPDSVISVGSYAFEDCTGLTSIMIPDGVTSIGDYAFYNCTGLTSITISDSVTSIGNHAFYNCTGLTNVEIPDSVTSIGSGAFYNCTGLTCITLPFVGNTKDGTSHTHFGHIFNAYRYSDNGEYVPASLKTVIITGGSAIDSYAFSGCTGLTSIVIPDSVTSIGENAFKECTSLNAVYISNLAVWCQIEFGSIYANPMSYGGYLYVDGELLTECVVPDDITAILDYTFSGCTSLKSVTVPEGVMSIGRSAFRDCTSITSITVSDSVTSIGYSAFQGCKNLTSITIPFVGASKDGTGDTYFGYIFGTSNYSNHKGYLPASLKTVVITGGNTIDDHAFEGCTGLTSITISNSVTSIGINAFSGCTSLTNIIIPDGVATIGYGAFSGCTSLTSIAIPNSVTSIGRATFNGCTSLSSLTIPFVGASKDETSDTFFGYIFGAFSTDYHLEYVPRSLKTVIITGGNTIRANAFKDCTGLTSIVISGSIISIGDSVFSGCTSLSEVVLEENSKLEFIGAENTTLVQLLTADNGYVNNKILAHVDNSATGVYTVDQKTTQIYTDAFKDCSYLTEIVVPESVKYIETGAFVGCSNLNKMTLPISCTSQFGMIFGKTNYTGSVYAYGYYVPTALRTVVLTGEGEVSNNMFRGCSMLTTITASGSTSIGHYAFYDCTNLTTLTLSNNYTLVGDYAFGNCSGIRTLVIPASATRFGNKPFSCMTGLTDLTISMSEIPPYMFSGMTNLQKITFAGGELISIGAHAFEDCASLTSFVMPDSVQTLGDFAFKGCSGLTNVTLSKNLKSIGNSAFRGCSGIGVLTFGTELNTIGESAFYGCKGLTALVLPASVTTIGQKAFFYCNGIKTLTLSENLLSIGESAFEGCTQLTALVIPDKVESLGNRAFYGCTNLNVLKLGATLESIGQYAFYGCSKLTTLTISNNVKTVGNYAFQNCSSLGGLTIGDSVTALGDYAFNGCTSLTTVTIGTGIEQIGNYTFLGCSKLANVRIDGKVTTLGTGAFKNCTALTGIAIPDVTMLGVEAFYGCSKLTYVTLGKVTDFGAKAFYGCSSLKSIEIPATVTAIGEYTFYNCVALENVLLNEGLTTLGNSAFENCKSIKSIVFPTTLTAVGNRVFAGSGLVSIDLGSTVTMIGTEMFMNCTALETVLGGENVSVIADKAFYGCTSLKNFDFSPDLLSISNQAFYNCTSLEKIILPEGLTVLGENAFVNCSGAKEIYIPSSMLYLMKGTFKGCGSVEKITVPFIGTSNDAVTPSASTLFGFIFGDVSYAGSVAVTQYYTETASATYYVPAGLERIVVTNSTTLFYGAFSGLTGVKEISIPKSVVIIENNVINNMDALELIYFRGTEAEWNAITKATGWAGNADGYEIRFVDGNLVRVTLLDADGNRMSIEATLTAANGTVYSGLQTYFGSGIENVPNGEYTLKITSGSLIKEISVTVDGDEEFIINSTDLDILDQFADREMIVVLEWGEYPRDLDSHMTFNDGTNSYHVYFANDVDVTTGTNLDVDDTSSYGPEVITVLEIQEGIYRYSIYDFSHGTSMTSNGIATSGAFIKVYIEGELIAQYNAPTDGVGCLWTVFEYNGTTGEITEINTMSGGMSSEQVN